LESVIEKNEIQFSLFHIISLNVSILFYCVCFTGRIFNPSRWFTLGSILGMPGARGGSSEQGRLKPALLQIMKDESQQGSIVSPASSFWLPS
jgi:hypothetical protein